MTTALDMILDQYEQGALDRRQFVQTFTAAVVGTLGVRDAQAADAKAPWAPALSINHAHIYVRDLARSVEFYATVLGAKPKEAGKNIQTMYLPGAKPGFGSWISISELPDSNSAPRVDHVGYGIIGNRATLYPRIAELLTTRYPDLKPARVFKTRAAGDEIYFTDPDGLPVQLIQIEHNGELSGH